ncbi:NADPH-dependent 7-cyano-7-deazaguanine reductase QueF [Saccharophagus sp. K07]|uniref:NADPH-dependent 7-cyano-7-deazaguanine reductase QueF n=1 Tax=Saccharophagus sp. K07 TaxID=2283636 RepID=UPI0016525E79|nr:NADPH-dependent 7-cyano-7-deazaguanine reductase QueF [Saccharophagus sp. K07]MBC6904428.1 NADPH-dependent 7-cyano-7-deazaguanine reductase QueF [Saccharophagus sp. K07]
MNDQLSELKLGKQQAYPDHYDAGLLQPIPRALSRSHLNRQSFYGSDIWTGYELSWLCPGGKPQVCIAEFSIPANSPNLIESKSFKYYLNSFNQTEIASKDELLKTMERDLSAVAGAPVAIRLYGLEEYRKRAEVAPEAVLLDDIEIQVNGYQPDANLLRPVDGEFDGIWCSHLLKSNCPVTGQPDWASIWIRWRGRALDQAALLQYIVGYRQHQDFHENCVERIYVDLEAAGSPSELWVYARYTRRGGLDINPFRSSHPMDAPVWLAPRQ